ncbi:MAG: Transcription factor iws1 [Alyxoria varia]|nr:MAG: Transcription factor iws1 [Alyxoria varia]
MEDLATPSQSPPQSPYDEDIPESAKDPLRPEVEEENSTPTPPLGAPQQDTEVVEENDDPEDDPDKDSDLSDIDEDLIKDMDFNPADIAIEDEPIDIDGSNVHRLKADKKKRPLADGEEPPKKKKKKKRDRRRGNDEDNFVGGETIDGKRARKGKDAAGHRSGQGVAANEEDLPPEERRRIALDRAMDEAIKSGKPSARRQGGIEVEAANDAMVEELQRRMADAARLDAADRDAGKPATRKLKMLPEVMGVLKSSHLRNHILDPETNLFQSVRFFLEPLQDGSLPAYNIQHELFKVMTSLGLNKDTLIASAVGQVVAFYTKSTKVEPNIKRMAERLVAEWTRPILNRNTNYRKKAIPVADFNPNERPRNSENVDPTAAALAAARERKLAAPSMYKRVRKDETLKTYTIAPRSNITAQPQYARPTGAAGEEMVRRIKKRQQLRTGRQ